MHQYHEISVEHARGLQGKHFQFHTVNVQNQHKTEGKLKYIFISNKHHIIKHT